MNKQNKNKALLFAENMLKETNRLEDLKTEHKQDNKKDKLQKSSKK